jgi:hypothetical protein
MSESVIDDDFRSMLFASCGCIHASALRIPDKLILLPNMLCSQPENPDKYDRSANVASASPK